MAITGRFTGGRRRQPPLIQQNPRNDKNNSFFPKIKLTYSRKTFRTIIIILSFIALAPPIFFHFRLRHFHQVQLKKCGWINNPPLVCAHGGDSTNAFPNTANSYYLAIRSKADCIEIDVSRSLDGVLFALHDRDLQRIPGHNASKVGQLTMKEIKDLHVPHKIGEEFRDQKIPTIENALELTSSSVRQIIIDAKVGPPSHEKGLAKDIISAVDRTECKNCLIWAKDDNLVREVTKLSADVTTGYIVMTDPKTGNRMNLVRMKGAEVVGVYHPLIDEKLVRTLHGRRKKVYAWTVDDENSMRRMLLERVDAIITSNPGLLQKLMQDIKTKCREEGVSLLR